MPKQNIQEKSQDKHSEKKSIIQTLLDEYNKQPKKVVEQQVKVVEDSISRKLLQSVKASKRQLKDEEKHSVKRYC